MVPEQTNRWVKFIDTHGNKKRMWLSECTAECNKDLMTVYTCTDKSLVPIYCKYSSVKSILCVNTISASIHHGLLAKWIKPKQRKICVGAESGKTTHFAGSGCCYDNHYLWLFFLFFQLLLNLLQSCSFPFSHPIFPLFYRLLFQTDCLSSSVLVHWVMWLFSFSVEAWSLVIGWYRSKSTFYIYVGNTNRRTDEQMEIEREGETDAERCNYLLRLPAVHSTHLFPLMG